MEMHLKKRVVTATSGGCEGSDPSLHNGVESWISEMTQRHQQKHGASDADATAQIGFTSLSTILKTKSNGLLEEGKNNVAKLTHCEEETGEEINSAVKTVISSMSYFVWLFTTCIAVLTIVSFISYYIFSAPHSDNMFVYKKNVSSREVLKQFSYGSTDLLTEDLKQKVLERVAHSSETLQDMKRELKLERMKFGGVSYMTIDAQELVTSASQSKQSQFIVVFDAGSTGTRVHVLEFQVHGTALKLESEFFQHVKPGLSEFVDRPDEALASIQPLVNAAMDAVPRHLHGLTPLIFKATAGLRLLHPVGAEQLLIRVRELMMTTDFSYGPEDISIMGGVEEGLYGWITVNYLLGHLDMDSVTAATLDLGGGSVQVTHEPVHLDNEMMSSADDLKWLEMFGNDFHLFTHSYLGLGLKAARNNTFTKGEDGVLTSDCLPPNYTGIFHYNGVNYNIRGPEERTLDGCWRQVGNFLNASHLMDMADSVRNPRTPDVYLFSYFYDCMVWAEAIDESETEKTLTLQDYYRAAESACQASHDSVPFLCQDLTYIVRLLGEVFMLWDQPLNVVKKIDSRETSWAIGAALGALSSQKNV